MLLRLLYSTANPHVFQKKKPRTNTHSPQTQQKSKKRIEEGTERGKKFKNDGSGRYLRLKPVMEKLEESFFSQIRKPSHQSKGNNGQRYG
jgi:hypothetical protein